MAAVILQWNEFLLPDSMMVGKALINPSMVGLVKKKKKKKSQRGKPHSNTANTFYPVKTVTLP